MSRRIKVVSGREYRFFPADADLTVEWIDAACDATLLEDGTIERVMWIPDHVRYRSRKVEA